MKVFVVEYLVDYEPGGVLAVFARLKDANDRVEAATRHERGCPEFDGGCATAWLEAYDRWKNEHPGHAGADGYEIHEMEVIQ